MPDNTANKVLVIDDEPFVRESISVYLEDSGYRVFGAVDGRQGVELFLEHQPDVVLCDLRMPDMDGMEVLKTLAKHSPATPVIMVSGAGQINDVVEALRLGALDYLVKPVSDMAVLEHAITNALHRQQLEQENLVYRRELEDATAELDRNLELLQQDHEAGRRAQLQLLPEPDMSLGGFHFEHLIIPSANLSGDFIDYFQISPDYIGFYIADVSGHGAASAFVTMTLKSLVNQPLRQFRKGDNETIVRPAEFMKYLNREFIKANLGKHITMFYGVLDLRNNQLDYSVAGQYPAPLIIKEGHAVLVAEEGFPLGLFDWASFESKQLSITDDFRIMMVSDGWLDLTADPQANTGEKFLLDFVKDKPLTIEDFMRPVKKNAQQNSRDDIALFIVSKEQE